MTSYAVIIKSKLDAPTEIIRPCTWHAALKIAAKEARELGFKRTSGKVWSQTEPWGYVSIIRE